MSDTVDNPGRKGLRVASAIDPASAHAASHAELGRSASDPMVVAGEGGTTLKVRSPVLAKKIAEQQEQQPHKQRGTVFATVIQEVREDLDAFAQTLRAAFGFTPSPKQGSAKDEATGEEEVSSPPPSRLTDPNEARAGPAGDEVSISIPEQAPSTGKGEGVPQTPPRPPSLDVHLEIHDSPSESPAFTPSDEKVVNRLQKRFEALESSASRLEGQASVDAKERAQKVLVKLNSLKRMDERSKAIPEEGPSGDLSK